MIDYTNLETAMETLSGNDYRESEEIERMKGNDATVISATTGFQVRLAAIALKCTPEDVYELPIADFVALTARTSIFLAKCLPQNLPVTKSKK